MISFVSFSDELVKISQLAPLIKKMVPEGVKSLKRGAERGRSDW